MRTLLCICSIGLFISVCCCIAPAQAVFKVGIAGDYLADNHSKENIAIMHDNTSYSLGLAEFTKHQLNKRGVTEAIYDSYEQDQKDYQSTVNKLFNKKIDVPSRRMLSLTP